ncbi:MAG: ricin-type beta-trefoil lectin domain protein [Anaerolineaceae bacterium]|nr:ricin-type beta-trefoil lectin domain protein [Anaerolineaceae bacterium]
MKSARAVRLLLVWAVTIVLASACAAAPVTSSSALSSAGTEAQPSPLATEETTAPATDTPTLASTAPAAAPAGGITPAAVEANSATAKVYFIQSAVSQQVLTDSAAGQNGATVEQQPSKGASEQQWSLVPLDDSGSLFLIQSADGSRCLDSVGGAANQEGTLVLLNPCDQSDGQKWQQISCADDSYACKQAPGSVWLVTPANGRVLDLPDDSTETGEKIDTLAFRHGGMNQLWYLQPAQ